MASDITINISLHNNEQFNNQLHVKRTKAENSYGDIMLSRNESADLKFDGLRDRTRPAIAISGLRIRGHFWSTALLTSVKTKLAISLGHSAKDKHQND